MFFVLPDTQKKTRKTENSFDGNHRFCHKRFGKRPPSRDNGHHSRDSGHHCQNRKRKAVETRKHRNPNHECQKRGCPKRRKNKSVGRKIQPVINRRIF